VLGCEAQVHPQFFEMSQSEYEKLFEDGADADKVLKHFKDQANSTETLKKACARI